MGDLVDLVVMDLDLVVMDLVDLVVMDLVDLEVDLVDLEVMNLDLVDLVDLVVMDLVDLVVMDLVDLVDLEVDLEVADEWLAATDDGFKYDRFKYCHIFLYELCHLFFDRNYNKLCM